MLTKFIIRHRAREFLIQAIYSWQLSGNNIEDIEKTFLCKTHILNFDKKYFQEILFGVLENVFDLDQKIAPHLSRNIKTLDQIEKAILRLATFELWYRNDIPYKVTIDEAIKLAKIFGGEKSHKFINGALDKALSSIQK